jgi:hypothetical protein
MGAPNTIRLPRYTGPDMALRIWSEAVCRALESELTALRSPNGAAYTITGGTGSRALTVSTATATQTADLLATVISDLKAKGQIA